MTAPAPAAAAAVLAQAVQRLAAAGVAGPAGDARRLLAHALGVEAGRLTLILSDPLPAAAAERFEALIAARARRVPVSHLTGQRMFWGRDFAVTPDVLDPRPETEVLVAEALAGPFSRVLDLGTGSGCILVTLLAEREGARGVGLDLSAAALAVAAENARRHGVFGRAAFALSDWWAAAEGQFDLIVANPPYVAAAEMAGLAPEVRDHEPHLALTDGGDGLSAYRAILAGLGDHLAPGGRALFEIGAGQGAAVAALARAAGLGVERLLPDLDGRDRVVVLPARQSGH